MNTLREKLTEWTDIDIAAFHLAQNLGLMGKDVRFHLEAKHIFWSNNSVGNTLYNMLKELANLGILEYREDPDLQFKWNNSFVGSWETKIKT